MPKNDTSVDLCVYDKCNNRCLMCTNPDRPWPAWDNKTGYNWRDIIGRLKKFRDKIDSAESIYLSGGEPTIHPRFREIIKYLTEKFSGKKIKLLTNGRFFSYPQKAEEFLAMGDNLEIDVSLYGHDKKTHEAVTRAAGSFDQTMAGLSNLLKRKKPSQLIGARFVITRLSYQNIKPVLKLILDNFPTIDRLIVIFPEMEGQAIKNKKNVALTYAQVRPFINQIAELAPKFKEFRLYHFPLCTLDKKIWPYAWRTLPAKEIKFLPACNLCQVKNHCLGIHRGYLTNIGRDGFQPYKNKVATKSTGNPYQPLAEIEKSAQNQAKTKTKI